MRLTDEVMRTADECRDADIRQTMLTAAAGRFGLIPSTRPFQMSLNVTNSHIDVEVLDCLAITRSGQLIDIQFDTRFTKPFETSVSIPENEDVKEYLVTICATPDSWNETDGGLVETAYTIALIPQNSLLPDDAMPIGRIVKDEEEWKEDNIYFVPPCLYVSSHRLMEELHQKFIDILRSINEKTQAQLNTGARVAIASYWPLVQQVFIEANTRHDILTPMELLADVQRVIAAFTCACELDDALQLEDAETFKKFVQLPYNYQNAYLRIRQGLGMCYAISEKVDKFSLLQIENPQPIPQKKEEPQKIDPRRLWDGKCI